FCTCWASTIAAFPIVSKAATNASPTSTTRTSRAVCRFRLSPPSRRSRTVIEWEPAKLQMFGRSLEHAGRADRAKIALTDVNLSIGEFGQQKMDELERDARNDQNELKRVIGTI